MAVPVVAQRTWQRKWRDVLHARQALADTYAGERLDVDDLARRVECFFKACRELGDWIQESTTGIAEWRRFFLQHNLDPNT